MLTSLALFGFQTAEQRVAYQRERSERFRFLCQARAKPEAPRQAQRPGQVSGVSRERPASERSERPQSVIKERREELREHRIERRWPFEVR